MTRLLLTLNAQFCTVWLRRRFRLSVSRPDDVDISAVGRRITRIGANFAHARNRLLLRIVQDGAFGLSGTAAEGNLRGQAHPLDTHIFLHGEESDERMEKLLTMAQNTCYLHALVHAPLEPEVVLEINGNTAVTS